MIAEKVSASHGDLLDSKQGESLSFSSVFDSIRANLGVVLLGSVGGAMLPSCIAPSEREQALTAVELANYQAKEELKEQNLNNYNELRERVEQELQDAISRKFPELFYQEQGRMVGELATALEARASIESGTDQSWHHMMTEWRSRSGEMINSMLNPLVRLNGDRTVGSGVIIFSEQGSSIQKRESLIFTSWHVVRDILNDGGLGRESNQIAQEKQPIPVEVFKNSEFVSNQVAYLVHFDEHSDLALLSMKDEASFSVAKLATAEQAANMRAFDPVFAVGCPLGNEPIPTFGIVSDPTHIIEGHQYMMVSSPTYIGNSGGAIFSGYDNEFRLVGLFSKIYTHGSVRPEIVTHMGLSTSMVEGQRFLAEAGYAVNEDGELVKIIRPDLLTILEDDGTLIK